MEQFYMCYSDRWGRDEVLEFAHENNVGLLTNAHTRWSDITEQFNEVWNYDCPSVIDSGGYNVQSRYANRDGGLKQGVGTEDISAELETDTPFFPWTVEEYHTWLHEEGEDLDWAAAMDYACEGRFDTLWSVDDRIEATIENTLEQHELMERDDSDYTLLPVLQGRTVDDYVRCANIFESAGIDISYVGIGTVCRLASSKKIVEIEEAVRERTNVELTHGFGVKIDAYKLGAGFHTADTHAWVYNATYGNVTTLRYAEDGSVKMDNREGENVPDKRRKVHSFKAYWAYINWLMSGNTELVDIIIEEQEHIPYGEKIN